MHDTKANSDLPNLHSLSRYIESRGSNAIRRSSRAGFPLANRRRPRPTYEASIRRRSHGKGAA